MFSYNGTRKLKAHVIKFSLIWGHDQKIYYLIPSQVKECKNEFLILAKSCTRKNRMNEKQKLIFLVFAHSVKKYNILNNKIVVNDCQCTVFWQKICLLWIEII